MKLRVTGRGRHATIVAALLLIAPMATFAQSGPMTGSLPEVEPADYDFRLGPFLFSPNVSITEAGVDTNVFDEPVSPKRDYMLTLTPDMQIYARTGLLLFSGVTSNDFTYYHEYQSERSISRNYRGRLEFLLSRVRPWIAGAHVQKRTRPNDEIDLRARRAEIELSGGVGFEISPLARFFVMGSRLRTRFDDNQIFRATDLAQTLNRREEAFAGGVRIQATPFTIVTLSGGISRDRFDQTGSRNAETRGATVEVEFSPEAIVRGRAELSFDDFKPDNPSIPSYRGITGAAALTYTVLDRATVTGEFSRGVQYSFETSESYFIDTGADVTWTQKLFGPWDVLGRYSRQWLDYAEVGVAAVSGSNPAVNAYQVGVGYNLQDNSRLGFNYEYAERVSDARPDRRFNRRRFFGSYTYGFR